MPKQLRIVLLLLVLALVAGTHFYQRHTLSQWRTPLRVEIYPINADGANETAVYIQHLSAADFDAIGAFFAREGARHGLARPTRCRCACVRSCTRCRPRRRPSPVRGG